jgi:excisionase family DNA binding protein
MQTKTNGEKPYTIAGAAERLGVSPFTVRSWITRRRLGHLKLGRAVRVPVQEIERLLAASFTPPLEP